MSIFQPTKNNLFIDTVKEIPDTIGRFRTGTRDFLRPSQSTQELEQERQQTLFPTEVQRLKTDQALKFGSIPLSSKPITFYKNKEGYADINFAGPLKNVGNKVIQKVAPPIFGGLKNLSTKLLEKFKGMPENITRQQFNEVLNKTRREGLKKVDEDLITGIVNKQGDKINLTNVANEAQTQLVPLTPTNVASPRRSNVGQDFIGDGKYFETIYQSPIKTSAGDVHFNKSLGEDVDMFGQLDKNQGFPNYFSHTRGEILPDGKGVKYLEFQSDLFQKENFAQEGYTPRPGQTQQQMLDEINQSNISSIKESPIGKRTAELAKLEPYSSNDPLAQLRTFREEVSRQAKAGKTYLLTPTGDTAMKIEGLGKTPKAWIAEPYPNKYGGRTIPDMNTATVLSADNMKVGTEVHIGTGGQMPHDTHIITDVLGDGKFKAVPKEVWDSTVGKGTSGDHNVYFSKALRDRAIETSRETFDISGKVDQQHFVYKLNEQSIPREARRMGLTVSKLENLNEPDKFNMTTRETVPGSWWRIEIDKARAKMPVEAFGKAPISTLLGGAGAASLFVGADQANDFLSEKFNTASYQAAPLQPKQIKLAQTFIGTNYDPYDPNQTRPNPDGIGAAGIKIDESMVATSLKKNGITGNLRLGTVIYVASLNKVFLVADVMNKRFNGMNKIDFATPGSGSATSTEHNTDFSDISIIRQGQGKGEDTRNFVESGEWDKLKAQYNQ